MVFGVGHGGLEARQVEAGAEGEAGAVATAGGLELVGAAEIVAGAEADGGDGQDVDAHGQMVERLLAETELFALGVEVVVAAPAGEVGERDAEAYGRVGHAFGEAGLEVEGHAGRAAVERLEFGAHVTQRGREGEVALFVVVVEAEVHGKGEGGIAGIVAADGLEGRTAGPAVGEEVAVGAAEDDVLGREAAEHGAGLVGLVHGAVAHVLRGEGGGVALAEGLDELRAEPTAAAGKGHEVEAQTAVAHGGVEGRIAPAGPRRVFDGRYILAAQRGHTRRDGQAEHFVGGRTLLGRRPAEEQKAQDEKEAFFHSVRKNCVQRYYKI